MVGALIARLGSARRSLYLAMLCGTLLCYFSGTAWFMLVTGSGMPGALSACVLPFIPGDLLKILLAAALRMRLEKPLRAAGLCV